MTGRWFGKIAGFLGAGGGSGRGEKDSGRELGEELPDQQQNKNILATSQQNDVAPQSHRARVTSSIAGALGGSPTDLPDSTRAPTQARERFYSSGNPFVKRTEVDTLDSDRRVPTSSFQ